MKYLIAGLVAALLSFTAFASDRNEKGISEEAQIKLDEWKVQLSEFAKDPRIIKAVEAQNKKGPISGMTKDKWKKVRRRDDMIKGFQSNDAAKAMVDFQKKSDGKVSEAFLNAAKGEKVAFIEKTSSYIHKGKSKFDVPFDTLKAWQGSLEFDESSQTYQVQISVPVFPKAQKTDAKPKPIGVIVVGINLEKL